MVRSDTGGCAAAEHSDPDARIIRYAPSSVSPKWITRPHGSAARRAFSLPFFSLSVMLSFDVARGGSSNQSGVGNLLEVTVVAGRDACGSSTTPARPHHA
jgi:hypothetical protein